MSSSKVADIAVTRAVKNMEKFLGDVHKNITEVENLWVCMSPEQRSQPEIRKNCEELLANLLCAKRLLLAKINEVRNKAKMSD